jgi:predicted DNA-binding protein
MKRDKQIGIRLAVNTVDALQALANADKRPLAAYIRLLLEAHVEQTRSDSTKRNG